MWSLLRRPMGLLKLFQHTWQCGLFFLLLTASCRSTWAGILASISSIPIPSGYMMLYRVRHSYDHYIDSQAEVVHHSMSGDWEFYMGRHLGIDFHRSQSPLKL